MYGFLVTVNDTDSRNNVIRTIRGTNSILDLIEGRDQETAGQESWFNRFVLKPSLLPVGTPEISIIAGMGIGATVPAVVRNEINDNRVFWWTLEFAASLSLTRQQMQLRMTTEARISRAITHAWTIIPGDTLTVAAAGQPGDLLSKFQLLT